MSANGDLLLSDLSWPAHKACKRKHHRCSLDLGKQPHHQKAPAPSTPAPCGILWTENPQLLLSEQLGRKNMISCFIRPHFGFRHPAKKQSKFLVILKVKSKGTQSFSLVLQATSLGQRQGHEPSHSRLDMVLKVCSYNFKVVWSGWAEKTHFLRGKHSFPPSNFYAHNP